MSEPDRPPLHPVTCEQIDMLLHKIDQRHWQIIAAFRIARFIPQAIPSPPQSPHHLMGAFRVYACDLFKTEADQYEQFLNDGRYGAWIARLEERVLKRVVDAATKIEDADKNLTLSYHGLNTQAITNELRGTLWEAGNSYKWKASGSGISPALVKAAQEKFAAQVTPPAPQPAPNESGVTPQQESIADQIRQLRRESALTVDEIASALDVDARSINRHLAGKAKPRRAHIVAYEKLFSERLNRKVIIKRH